MDTLNGSVIQDLEPEIEDQDQVQDDDQDQDLGQDQDRDHDQDRPDPEGDYSEIEKIALEMNWDPNGERSAKEFIFELDNLRRAQRKKIRQEKRQHEAELRAMREKLDEISTHMRSQRETEREREIRSLEQKRDQAFEDQDKQAFEDADRKLRELEKNQGKAPGAPDSPDNGNPKRDPRVESWMQKNPWYNSGENTRERHVADAVFAECQADGLSVTESLQEVDEEIKRYRGLNSKKKPNLPPVGGGRPGSANKTRGVTVEQLRREYPQAYDIMQGFVKAGTPGPDGKPMTPETYIKYFFEE